MLYNTVVYFRFFLAWFHVWRAESTTYVKHRPCVSEASKNIGQRKSRNIVEPAPDDPKGVTVNMFVNRRDVLGDGVFTHKMRFCVAPVGLVYSLSEACMVLWVLGI